MRKTPPLLLGAFALLAASLVPGCGTPVRACTGCKYKSQVSFTNLPTGTITSAQMEVKVKHSGACPQSDKPANCTEVMTYDVLCKLGTASAITVPFFIDASPTIRTHTAKITVVKSGNTTVHTGTVNMTSNVDGGGPPPTTTMPTPCSPPALNPYDPFPNIE
jgi:hypothetical protein